MPRVLILFVTVAGTALAQPAEPPAGWSPLSDLPRLGGPVFERSASTDPTGANNDFRPIPPGGTITIFEHSGPGVIRKLWCTLAAKEENHLRKIVVRMYWDDETNASVNVPLGDFFGLGHAQYCHYVSAPMNAAVGKGLSCFFPMPFSKSARIEIENQGEQEVRKCYWQIDCEPTLPPGELGRFHAQFRRENPTVAAPGTGPEEGYLLLDAEGKGRYVGCVLSVQSLAPQWWGEGDEFMDIDGRRIPGTGLEDYFCCAWGFTQPFWAPSFGVPYVEPKKEPERATAYRWHLDDPVFFEKSIRILMEHGSQNERADDWSSVAYWYQTEPHKEFDLIPVAERIPRPMKEAVGPSPESVEVPGAPTAEQPRRIVVPPSEEEPGTSPFVAALEVVLLLVWLPVALAAAGWWYIKRSRR